MRTFNFNGIDSGQYLIVNKVKQSLLPNIKRNYINIPGKAGAYLGNTNLGVKVFEINITLISNGVNNYEELKDNIKKWLFTERECELSFSNRRDVTYFAVLDNSVDLDELFVFGEGTIVFVCPDPFGYGIENSYKFQHDPDYPGDPIALDIKGTYKTQPRFRVFFLNPSDELKIIHENTGKYVRLIRNFSAGDVLEFDFSNGKILLNGKITMQIYDWFNSNQFSFDIGNQLIRVEPAEAVETIVFWRPRYI
ncbi:distal tail protein Dit [Bacillus sp. JJ1533]|uniref:distal tail protein Dit n=1 Tax=Bacillus sp. JJ1533 TaxID=3122959 RepID=UPI002FFFDB04